jgi:hypothetical protein
MSSDIEKAQTIEMVDNAGIDGERQMEMETNTETETVVRVHDVKGSDGELQQVARKFWSSALSAAVNLSHSLQQQFSVALSQSLSLWPTQQQVSIESTTRTHPLQSLPVMVQELHDQKKRQRQRGIEKDKDKEKEKDKKKKSKTIKQWEEYRPARIHTAKHLLDNLPQHNKVLDPAIELFFSKHEETGQTTIVMEVSEVDHLEIAKHPLVLDVMFEMLLPAMAKDLYGFDGDDNLEYEVIDE